MRLTLPTVKSIAHTIALQYEPQVTVLGVTRFEGGGDLAEIILASTAPNGDARTLSIPVNRREGEAHLRASLVEALNRRFKPLEHLA